MLRRLGKGNGRSLASLLAGRYDLIIVRLAVWRGPAREFARAGEVGSRWRFEARKSGCSRSQPGASSSCGTGLPGRGQVACGGIGTSGVATASST